MSTLLLIDSDVLIDYLRGAPSAIEFLEPVHATAKVSAISVAELFAGVRGDKEHDQLHNFISAFQIQPVTASIARRGGLLRRDYGPSHGTGLADALIGATAQECEATLVTLNRKHFPMLEEILVPYSKPAGNP